VTGDQLKRSGSITAAVTRPRAAAALLLALLAGALPAGAQRAPRAEIYFPPDHTLVEERYLTVEGREPASETDDLEIVVNDDAYRTRVRRFTFAEQVALQPGENVIRIGGAVRRVYYAAKKEKPPAGYARVFGHVGLGDGCAECHTVTEGGGFTLAGPREELCSWCHNDVVAGPKGKRFASVHGPVRRGECLSCHVAHTAANPKLLREKVPTCGECHPAVFEGLKKDRFVHGPLNLGDCRLCHAVHGSPERGLLLRPATSLCTDCHSDVLPPPGTPAALAPHRMIPEGICAKCHFPHSSNNDKLMRLPAGRLCHECHPDNTRSFHEAKGFSIYICAKCHALHRPSMPHLIVDASRSLCTECHRPVENAASAHAAAQEGQCFVCHSFHKAALATDTATLCLRCHAGNSALAGAHRGVAFEKSRCTSCHLPHASPLPKLLLPFAHTPFARRECGRCHRAGEPAAREASRAECLACHEGLDLGKAPKEPETTHPPFTDEGCGHCHASHASRNPGQLREPQLRLCLECHRELRKATVLQPTSYHPAFLEGKCTGCHAPHFSESPALLRQPQPQLCPSCHPGVLAPGGQPWANPHPPAAQGQCVACHRPHSSALPKLLRPPAQRGCRTCHERFFAELASAANVSRHAPVREDNCQSCHQLHGSAGKALLRPGAMQVVCMSCHSDWKNFHHLISKDELAEKPGGQSAKERGCLHCHRPHASTERKLLLPMRSPSCVGCHRK
jgi:predicted CXXCH cytochrome family protein